MIYFVTLMVVMVALWIYFAFLDPTRCTCGAPEMLQFGIFVEHSANCPQNPANVAERERKQKHG